MSDKSENILIGYTKWLLKWFAIVGIVIGVGSGSWLGYEGYQNQIVPMIAIKCEKNDFSGSPKIGDTKTILHYLVQKRRKNTFPEGLYRPSYHNNPITQDTSPDDYWRESPFKRSTLWNGRPSYLFGYQKSYGGPESQMHWIDRRNLQVIHFDTNKKSGKLEQKTVGKCRQITFDEFYADSERELNEVKSKLKF